MALMTNMKRPRVRIVAGSVRITNIGFSKRLRRAKTKATIMAVV